MLQVWFNRLRILRLESNQKSWQQPKLIQGSYGIPFARNSKSYNPVPELELSFADKICSSGAPSSSIFGDPVYITIMYIFRKFLPCWVSLTTSETALSFRYISPHCLHNAHFSSPSCFIILSHPPHQFKLSILLPFTAGIQSLHHSSFFTHNLCGYRNCSLLIEDLTFISTQNKIHTISVSLGLGCLIQNDLIFQVACIYCKLHDFSSSTAEYYSIV